ncbi:MAG TPA: hypothetical protein VF011_08280 [Terriglobales bacterium]
MSFLFVAALLFTGGLLLSIFGLPYVNEHFSTSLGDAMMIAAMLGLTVDYFLKERVLREVSGDVSKYLIGYRLPAEVQDRIRWLLQTEWIRRNFHVRCRLTEIDESRVSLEITISEEIQNITSEPSVYQDFLEFERHDPTSVIELRCDCEDPKARYRIAGPDLQPKEKPDDPGVMQVQGKKVKIPPVHEAIGRTYNFAVRYVVEYPSQYSESINFSHATINVILEADCPNTYLFTASDADISGHNRWEYRRLFLPGESITFRWRRL